MKKILVFGITDNPGGIESVIMNYYRKIDRKNIQFDFLCNTQKVAYSDEIEKLGGKIYRITARSVNRKKFYSELDEFFKNHSSEYEAIWVNICSLANIDYLKYAKKYGIKKRIVHCHNSQNMDSKLRNVLHVINRLSIDKYATDFWTCNADSNNWFYGKKVVKNNKIVEINNAIDVKKYEYNEKTRNRVRKENGWDDKIVLGNVGRLHFQKNQIFALDIFSEFKKLHENAIFVLVGDGEDKEMLVQKTKELGIEDSVFFYGLRSDVPELLNGFDILLFPSLFEGLSLVLVESQCAKLLVMTSNTVSPDTKMSDYIYFLDLNDLASKWASFMDDKYKKFNRSKVTNQISELGYNIDTEAKKLEELLKG